MKYTKEILSHIRASAETGCVLKLSLKGAKNPVITAIDEFSEDRIVLKPTCLYGYPLEKRMVALSEIESVKRFKTQFDSPLFTKLRFIKNNISGLRNGFKNLAGESRKSFNPEIN